tara:strand:- start:463 stop:600 length:138 start_codon:yes stop_codon:yes gene_type:complete
MKKSKTKYVMLTFRLSKEDSDFIQEQCDNERLTKSAWVRRKIFLK